MPLESPIQRDGDMGFVGYSSRMNPVTLPAGMLQLSENMRLDRGVAQTRRGAKRLADDISPGTVPLTVPFVLTDPGPIVQAVYSGGIFAAATMRSPDETNSQEVILLAGPDRAFTYLPDGSISNSAAWGSDDLGVDENGDEDAETVLETDTGDVIFAQILPAEITYPTSPDELIEPTDKVSLLQAFDRLYLFREADSSVAGWTQKYTTTDGISVVGTTATVNVSAHAYPVGARVRIEGSQTSPAFNGHEYDVLTVSADSFTIAVPSGVASDISANLFVRRVKPPLYWDGTPGNDFVRAVAGVPDVGISYRRLRSVGWANYINNRLIVPDGKQNVLISDILNPDVFDIYWQSFRVGVGGNDFVVGVHPWVEGKVLVFCRKSIWLADIAQYPSPDGSSFTTETGISGLSLLTDEIGCAARRSITTAGAFIYFLSDSGVYRLDSRLDLKLRGDTRPLSDPISDQLSSLNAELVDQSIGLYFDNRFYIAVPLAGADTLNGVFIYNQLLEQWETRDVYGFGVNTFLVSDKSQERRVFISNQAGKLMLLDEQETGDDSPDATANLVTPVAGRIRSRRYGMDLMSAKRFIRSLSDVVMPNGGSLSISALTYNPDRTKRTGDRLPDAYQAVVNTSGVEEDYTLKQPIRQKAHYAEIEFLTNGNRPEIRNVSVEAALPSQAPTETRHAA